MGDNRDAKFAGVMSLTAAVAAVAAYLKNPVKGESGELIIPDEIVNLLAAMASTAGNIDSDLDAIIQQLQSLSVNVQGFPPNSTGIVAVAVNCPAANTAYRGPDIEVPEGRNLVIKNYPLNPFGVIVRVASEAPASINANSSFPLAVNDVYATGVTNMNKMFVSATIAGSLAIFSTEKKV